MRRHTDQAYLIRLWRDRADTPLRVTLTSAAVPHGSSDAAKPLRQQFASLDELQSFLIAQTRPNSVTDSQEVRDTTDWDHPKYTSDEAAGKDPIATPSRASIRKEDNPM